MSATKLLCTTSNTQGTKEPCVTTRKNITKTMIDESGMGSIESSNKAMATTQRTSTEMSTKQSTTTETSTPPTTETSTIQSITTTEMSTTQSTTPCAPTTMSSESTTTEPSTIKSTTTTTTTEIPTTQSTTPCAPTTLSSESTTSEPSTIKTTTTTEMSTTQSTTPCAPTTMTSESTTPEPSTIQSTTTTTITEMSTTQSTTPCAPTTLSSESTTSEPSTTQSTTSKVSTTQSAITETSQSTQTAMTQSISSATSTTAATTMQVSTTQSTPSQMSTITSTTTTGSPISTMMTTTPAPKCDPTVYNRFIQGIIAYNGKLLNELVSATAGSSFVFSTTSIFYLLGNVGLFQTEPEIKETLTTLNLQNKEQIRCVYPENRIKFDKETSNMNYYYLDSVYVSMENPISDDFRDDSNIVFNNLVQNVNFTNRAQTTDEINQNSERRTNITDVVSPDLFNSSTSVFFVTSKSLKIDLQKMFKPSEIKERDFRSGSGKNVKVPTMFKREIFPFMDNDTLKAKIVKIPHQENNVSLIIVLPDSPSKINEIAKKLEDPQVFNTILNMDNSRPTIVNLYMPFINITDTMDLKNTLMKTTTLKIFDAESPSLNITANQQLLSVTEGRIKISLDMAGLEVTGKLTKSAIAKQSGLMVPLRDETMRVDHPFIFYYLVNNIPGLCGVYAL
ncbi:hypothetical protein O3G_MSEX011798 [Manduca sexta]|uniref:Serpin domain-containing protein n=1 Tax=Manduca sexta TaxID=7130 RepID=A0A922CVR7_MANSE|nr:hypothetical protein O3G_MSEX011798 [Manduca sexta]